MDSTWPRFPRELLAALKAPEGAKLRIVLVDGGVLAVRAIAQESDAGLIVETEDGLSAVPWHAILRVEAPRSDVGKAVGFRRD